ncbi:ribosomal protein S5 domain 2-type protein [Aspergillus floccosus]
MPDLSLQNTDLAEEIEAINAIYDPDTITVTGTGAPTAPTLDLGATTTTTTSSSSSTPTTTITLQIPEHPHLSFILRFEASYPDTRPQIVGTASTAARGEGKLAVDVLEDIVQRTHQPGAVCLFDVLSEAVEAFHELNIGGTTTEPASQDATTPKESEVDQTDIARLSLRDAFGIEHPPEWVLSEVVTEKKSVFVGRAARVTSLAQARGFLDYLLATEKKVAAATHNIRKGEMIVQDCDDDGETAAGGRLLHLMQLMDVWDVVVVVTRWYGGVLLGPDRFRIINAVGRDALVRGGFVQSNEKKKGKKLDMPPPRASERVRPKDDG